MSREIKFRAWDKKRSHMLLAEDIAVMPMAEGVSPLTISGEAIGIRPDNDDFVLMQYTGLKDKNGVEIYEGDIVQLPYITPFGEVGGEGGIDERGTVVFAQGAFMLHMNFEPEARSMVGMIERRKGEYVSNYGNTTMYSDKTLFEVIGNIYENGELLALHEGKGENND